MQLINLYEEVFYALNSEDSECIFQAIKAIEKDCHYKKIHLYHQTKKDFAGCIADLTKHHDDRISKIAITISPLIYTSLH